MKLVRASQGKGPANRQEAMACVTANLALPGAGSLAAGKSIGYFQLALASVGFILTLITGIHTLLWMMGNSNNLNNPNADPVENMLTVWKEILWPLLSLCIFGVALLWAGITSLQILAAHPKNPVPPRIL
jgi:ABC-type Na+ efflux pump permease subunit